MAIRHKNRISLFIGILFVFRLAVAAQAADPPQAHGALWVPFAPGCEVSVAEDLPGVSMAFAWTGADYEQVDTLMPGYGYFLIPENADADLPLPDCRLDALGAQTTSITLHAGWNLLGNPLSHTLTFDAVADASGVRAQAFAARAAARSARAVISRGGEAQPGDVVWVYALQQGAFPLSGLADVSDDSAKFKSIQLIPARAHGDNSSVFYIPGTVSFSISVSYADGHSETLAPARAQWSVSDEKLGRFDEPGTLTALAPGAISVTAVLGGMSVSADVQLIVECEKVCLSAVVPQTEYSNVAAYEQFAENLRTQHLGIMPMPQSDCAYVEISGTNDIKSVKQATLGLIENIASKTSFVRAYCRQDFDSGAAAHVLFEADPLGGADRKVWLKDITSQAQWTWDNKDVIKGIAAAGIIQAGESGYANLTASYRGMQATPAFVGVAEDTPDRLQILIDMNGGKWLPAPWSAILCGQLIDGICGQEDLNKVLHRLSLGDSAPLFTTLYLKSGAQRYNHPDITWSAEPEGIVSISGQGVVTTLRAGRVAVRAHLDDLVSPPLDFVVEAESIKRLNGKVLASSSNSGTPQFVKNLVPADVVRVPKPTRLSFIFTADTSWSRTLTLKDSDVTWAVTDAAGRTVNAMDFSGPSPLHAMITYKNASLWFTVEKAEPRIEIFTQNLGTNYMLKPQNGKLYVSQPELLTFTAVVRDDLKTTDLTYHTQWQVVNPDGTITKGKPSLDKIGVYKVTATVQGTSHEFTIEVYAPRKKYILGLGTTQEFPNIGDMDNKFKAGEPFLITGFECVLQDWQTRGWNQVPFDQSSQALWLSSRCVRMKASAMDDLLVFETSDSDILTYESSGVVRPKRAGVGWLRARANGDETNALKIEVWEEANNFPMCAQTANQDVWHDTIAFTINREARSRAILQADCDTYKRGAPVKVRWFGQISKNLTHGIVNVKVDLDIKTCNGLQVKRLRCDTCKRAAARAATDFSDYTTVFDTVEEWDQTDDNGNAVGPGCYMAHAVFNIIVDPVLEVQFTIQ